MRSKLLLITAILLSLSCASLPKSIEAQIFPEKVETGAVLAVFGRYGIAHACPVGDGSFALTAGHVIDERPMDPNVGLQPARWSNRFGDSGILMPLRVAQTTDLGSGYNKVGKFPKPYQIASEPPSVGTQVTVVGYNYSNTGSALASKDVSSRVVRIVANNIVLSGDSRAGSSGSCVLNMAGEVVGIVVWGMPMDSGSKVVVASGVWKGLEEIDALLAPKSEVEGLFFFREVK